MLQFPDFFSCKGLAPGPPPQLMLLGVGIQKEPANTCWACHIPWSQNIHTEINLDLSWTHPPWWLPLIASCQKGLCRVLRESCQQVYLAIKSECNNIGWPGK